MPGSSSSSSPALSRAACCAGAGAGACAAREFASELVGTFVLVGFGDGAVASVVLHGSWSGNFATINWGYGLALLLGVLVSARASGAHLNPAVTTSLALLGRLPPWKVAHYLAAQYAGAFLGAAFVHSVYAAKLSAVLSGEDDGDPDKWRRKTAGIFATYPDETVGILSGFYVEVTLGSLRPPRSGCPDGIRERHIHHVDDNRSKTCAQFTYIKSPVGSPPPPSPPQMVLTGLLVFCVLAITDRRNVGVPAHLHPLYISLLLVAIGMCFGTNTGYAINPARDLGPR